MLKGLQASKLSMGEQSAKAGRRRFKSAPEQPGSSRRPTNELVATVLSHRTQEKRD